MKKAFALRFVMRMLLLLIILKRAQKAFPLGALAFFYAACKFCPFFCSLCRTMSRQVRCTAAVSTQLMG